MPGFTSTLHAPQGSAERSWSVNELTSATGFPSWSLIERPVAGLHEIGVLPLGVQSRAKTKIQLPCPAVKWTLRLCDSAFAMWYSCVFDVSLRGAGEAKLNRCKLIDTGSSRKMTCCSRVTGPARVFSL